MEEIKAEQLFFSYDKDSKCLLFDSFELYETLRVKNRIHAEPIGTLITNYN